MDGSATPEASKGFLFNTESMKFLEKDLEDILFKKITEENGYDHLKERGLYLYAGKSKKLRQPKIGNYGIADMVLVDVHKNYEVDELDNTIFPYLSFDITVIELKKDKISMSAFLQAIGYCRGIQSYLMGRKHSIFDIKFNIVLIGKSIDDRSEFSYLPDVLCNHIGFRLSHYLYNFDFDGIKFERVHGYKLVNEGF